MIFVIIPAIIWFVVKFTAPTKADKMDHFIISKAQRNQTADLDAVSQM
jgi:hypothetical protein